MKILCYGDSNTWGYVPNINGYSKDAIMQQYNEEECWWYDLKKDNEVFVDGLCGRCIAHENKCLRNRNALKTINDDLQKYNELDLVIIQLGTNDCKGEYKDSAFDITKNLEKLISHIRTLISSEILIISPAQIREDNKITKKYYIGAESKSADLDYYYKILAQKQNYSFISGTDLELGEDGEHLTLNGHKVLGQKVALYVKELNNNIHFR